MSFLKGVNLMNVIPSRATLCDVVGRNNISFDDALSLAKIHAPSRPETENLALLHSKSRILSTPLSAGHAVPPFANAAMDGYLSLIHI